MTEPGNLTLTLSRRIRALPLRIAAGLVFGALMLALLLRIVGPVDLMGMLARMSPGWALVSLGLYLVDLSLRAWRWQRLLSATHRLPYPSVWRALVCGYAMNNVIPARLGEVFRAGYCRQRFGMPASTALASILAERLMDAAVVLLALACGILALSRRGSATEASVALLVSGLVMLTGLIGLVVLLTLGARNPHRLPLPPFVQQRLPAMVDGLAGLRGSERVRTSALSVVIWSIEALALWCMVRAFGPTLALDALAIVVGLATLSTLLPSAPGFVGSYQAAYATAFSMVGESVPEGVAVATAVQLFLLLPTSLLGGFLLLHRRNST